MPDLSARIVLAGHLPPETKVISVIEDSKWWKRQEVGVEGVYSFMVPVNAKFRKKWWALVKFSFDHWEPIDTYKGIPVERDFERFRHQITILAGHYKVVASLTGEGVSKEAKSIAWAKMTEEQFEKFYQQTWNAIFNHVLSGYSKEDKERVMHELSMF